MKRTPGQDGAEIAIVGRSCRLPGARSVEALWGLLDAGRCAVSTVPADRWPQRRHGHPRIKEPGRSYTWAAGVLPDIWGFDPSVFRISPREAQQIDPQQRLLLELAFEACEDAGVAPSKLAGTQTGVYVGASQLDYSIIGIHDSAVVDAYYATGNTLSIVANRLSYIFDLHGPSLVVDTACSSSLVALHEARHALIRGEIDSALVGGISILASPFGFITFSQATMLSPTGLCRAFSAEADGYVRAEGGVVLLLKTVDKAIADGDRIHAVLRASAVNSDGRTSGISLPAEKYQSQLLQSVYRQADVDPDAIAYVEAHGTGTRVGDPVEASALGKVLGRARSRPLPIGSIKTNIGHTEPASGLAGLMKAMLALEHDRLPPTLHCDNLNPNIDFDSLNLIVSRAPTPLPRGDAPRFVGVSSFGFGGTSAHVVVGDPPSVRANGAAAAPRLILLSAQCEESLRALADEYAGRLAGVEPEEALRIIAATDHRRERMRERFIARVDGATDLASGLARFAETGRPTAGAIRGTAVDGDGAAVFVFSGNGAQWSGMGRAAYRTSAPFREALAEIDGHFAPLAGWSLIEEFASPDIVNDLGHTRIAQPMIFAIQAASVRALAAVGVRPSLTIGHSVGEVAAAEAAGVLTLRDAVRVIYHRSRCQEVTENAGGMAVIIGPREPAEDLVARIPGLTIAGHNSHRCIVVAGSFESLRRLDELGSANKLRARRLDLVYPFHSPLMHPVKPGLMDSLAGLAPAAGAIPFLSTVYAGLLPGAAADASYWWRNVREPVLFQESVEWALRSGKRVFLEIGPRPTLKGHVRDTAENVDTPALVSCVLEERPGDNGADSFEETAAQLLASGAEVGGQWAFGPDPGPGVALPAYPWRRTSYRFPDTSESTGQLGARSGHPLVGARDREATLEWRAIVDTDLEPSLADHQLRGQTILPGAAFIEMALAIANEWAGGEAALNDFEILQPLIFTPGASREILCRVSALTGTVEIMSRPRLSDTAYSPHARGKIIQKAGPAPQISAYPTPLDGAPAAEVYRRASASGLEFGPAFRQLHSAKVCDEGRIEVELTPSKGDQRYGLDPARLDSCFHGLILLFAERENAGGAYLPVRFNEVRLIQPGADLARASIQIRRCDDRVILADFDLFDRDGRLAAILRGARYQATRLRGEDSLKRLGLTRSWVAATRDIAGAAPLDEMRAALAAAPNESLGLVSSAMLTEGWATAAAYHFARGLAKDGFVDVDALIAEGRLPENRRRWAETVFAGLEQSGLLQRAGSKLRLDYEDVPRPEAVFVALAAQHPERAPELLLAAGVGSTLEKFAAGTGELAAPSEGAVEAYELRSTSARAAARTLSQQLEAIAGAEGAGALRILQIGVGPATHETERFAAERGARLTILDLDRRRLERARLNHYGQGEVAFCGELEALEDLGFDLVVSAGGLSRWAARRDVLSGLTGKCASGAVIVAVEPTPSLFRDITLGLAESETGNDDGRRLNAEAWATECARMGLKRIDARRVEAGPDEAALIIAEAPARAPRSVALDSVVIVRDGEHGLAAALRDTIKARGAACRLTRAAALKLERAGTYVWIAGAAKGDSVTRVAAQCLGLRDLVLALGHTKAKLIVAAPASDFAIAEAAFSFSRTLANEFPTLDLRRVEFAGAVARVADRLADIVLSNTAETDIAINDEGVSLLRWTPPNVEKREADDIDGGASRLEKSSDGGLDRLRWNPSRRVAPGADEVEVEVVATGLNFRDVMWALSILPDEMLEDGFAGPTLGLEFAGRITRVGASVERFKIGDEVVGLCGGAFASHVLVGAEHVAPLPSTLPLEAAATMPIAFLTAYYSLVSCADVQRGEWVLIHGGAGGVGLAALQIAQRRGARAIVTAGSPEKRALALAFGADYAFDSRSAAFVDDVLRVTEGRGVAVVLNSLAGEAMERSLGLLQPFGRFVELGKRDYLANTPIGLRPFRRNLSYFGVDLDQLLLLRPDISRQLFEKVLGLFASGQLTPLPFTTYGHDEIVEALRLMQQSGHIGKILIRPPQTAVGSASQRAARPFVVDPQRTHLITGGLGGFGLAAAEWLVDRGARHLALVGRSGASRDAAGRAVAALRERGVELRVASLDVADANAAEAFLADLKRTMPPLAGVMHAAMVLDDGIIANLDEKRLTGVLRPKIAGAEILDRLTRGLALDYFVLFSSATTTIGSPGQGAYVAANGFLEGLARQRRASGFPALAVAWGAIADVGVLARHAATRDSLAQRTGVKGVKARAALDALAEALAFDGGPGGDANVFIADVNWSAARGHLPLLNAPAYRGLAAGDAAVDTTSENGAVDLRELVQRLGADQARRAVVDILVEEVARVLRLPRDEVSRTKPLAEIGLDSLMAVELTLSLERRFAMDTPLSASAGASNVVDLAAIMLSTGRQGEENFEIAEGLAKRHLEKADWGDIAPLMTALQEKGVDLTGVTGRQSASA